MAERKSTLNVSRPIAGFPSIRVSMGGAKAFQGVAATLGKLGDQVEGELDRQAVAQGRREGTVAGATGTPTLREDEHTLSGASFNQAAREQYANQIDIAARERLAVLGVKHATDPAGFKKASESYLNGMLQEVNAVDPAIGAVFGQTYQLRAASTAASVRSAHSTLMKNNMRGSVVRLRDILNTEAQVFAGELLSEDPDKATLAFQNFTASSERLRLVMMKTAPNGEPIYKAEEREKVLIKFEDDFLEATGRGFIDQAKNKTAALAALTKTGGEIRIKVANEDGTEIVKKFSLLENMTSDQRNAVVKHAQAAANAESHALRAAEATARRMRVEVEKVTAKDLVDAAIDNSLTPEMVARARDDLKPSDFLFYSKIAKGGGALVDEESALTEVEDALREGRRSGNFENVRTLIKNKTTSGELTTNTYTGYEKRIQTLEDKDGPKSSYHATSRMLDNMMDALKGQDKRADTALGLASLSRSFDRWWANFKDPKTGETRDPTHDEADAKLLVLARNVLPNYGIRQIEGSLLTVPVPRGFISAKDKRERGAVRRENGSVDYDATADNYFKAFGVTSETPRGQWPRELKVLLHGLSRYRFEVEKMIDLIGQVHGRN